MGDLTFSGQYSLSVPKQRTFADVLNDATSFLLTTTNVRANIPGMKRPVEYFAGEVRNQRLVLFYIGKELNATRLPSQAHGFRKSWKGGWTW
jgi:hypothetical protein